MAKERASAVGDLAEGQTKRVEVGGRSVLLARFADGFHAIDAVCSHAGGALEDGEIDGTTVICPLHQACFDLRTGQASEDTDWATDLECFAVAVEGDDVFVDVSGAKPDAAASAAAACPHAGAAPRTFDYNPLLPSELADPYPTQARARREAPVFFSPIFNVWIVTRYDDIWRALKDPQTFSSAAAGTVATAPPREVLEAMKDAYPDVPTLLTNDPPRHSRFRALVNKAFTPRRVADREPRVREIANQLIDRFHAEGTADIVWQFAYPLPMRLIAETLGVPERDMDRFKRWSDASVERLSARLPVERQIELGRIVVEFQHYFAAEIEARQREPRDDMLNDIVHARLEGEKPLSVAEMLGVLQQILVAGNETTTNLIGNMTALLVEHPAEQQRLRENPSLLANAVEEVLRMEAPVQGLFRTTTRDVELGGVTVPKGAHLQLLYASGSRDDSQFPDGDRFDVGRKNASMHLAFGGGAHFCIGAGLARLEGRIALETILARLPNLRYAEDKPRNRTPHFFLRGFEHLWVEWDV